MSGNIFTCVTPEVSITGGAGSKMVIGLTASAHHRIHIKEISLGFKGTTVTNEPVTVQYVTNTVDGTGTAGVTQKQDLDASEDVNATFEYNYSVEPAEATSAIMRSFPIHPQGTIMQVMPIEGPIPVKGGTFWGVAVTPDDTVVAIVTLLCEE